MSDCAQPFEEAVVTVMLQERVDAGPQGHIVAAGLVEKRGAFLGVLDFHGLQEQFLFPRT